MTPTQLAKGVGFFLLFLSAPFLAIGLYWIAAFVFVGSHADGARLFVAVGLGGVGQLAGWAALSPASPGNRAPEADEEAQ